MICLIKKSNFNNNNTTILSFTYSRSLENISHLISEAGYTPVFQYKNTVQRSLIKNAPVPNTEAGTYQIQCKECDCSYFGEMAAHWIQE